MTLRLTTSFYLLSFLFVSNISAQSFDSVKIKTIKLTEKIFMLEGAGGNIGVLAGNDGTILIDDQFAPLTEKIKDALKLITDKPVKFIINTHFHFDHTGGNENFGKEGAVIVAQDNNRTRLSTDQFIAAFKDQQKAYPYEALPQVTFTESLTLHVNEETVQVFHVKNAHTDGDVIIHFKESNVFHTGDVFVRYGLPFIDQPNGGSIDGMIKAIDRLLSLSNNESKIIPGHGALSTRKDLLEYQHMLQTVRDRVAQKIKEGKTFKEIVDADVTKEFKADFLREVFIQSVYDSLKK